ncbi:uncharacterized protein LY89DRAFT_42537 [Mollisia scopiformis]|uniref:Uncharacterized protein n=1 Tax=Mollisia scopiformis TaxID=149040 RepID=A0A194XDJ3_MOLSC|nr:uncharacterized protein LY89DRAFT_42537 [Mollisia scopiformis]KUJ18224.1 hypothetical protein LY89DRAFT_42537 [Mollisia scopiformis]
MAPEPAVLKRKRSRPSDWWANGSIIASTPQRLPVPPPPPPAQDETELGPAKKRGRPSTGKLADRGIQDAPAAANRGRPAKKQRVEDVEDENGGDDELANDKPVKKTRSSATGEELRNIAGSSKDGQIGQRAKNKRGYKSTGEKERNTEDATEETSGPKRRGRPAAIQLQDQVVASETPLMGQNVPKRRGRPSASAVVEGAEEEDPVPVRNPARRGRLSNKEAETRAIAQESAQDEIEPKRRGRPPATEKIIEGVNDQEHAAQERPKKRGRRATIEEAVERPDEIPTRDLDGPKKRGRRPVEATNEGDAEEPVVPAASRRRTRRSDAQILEEDSTHLEKDHEPERGRRRSRRSEINIIDVELTAPRAPSEEERGRRRTRLSDAQSQQVPESSAMKKGRGKEQKASRRPETTTVEIESASSKLTKAPNKKTGRAAPSKPARQDLAKSKRSQPPTSSFNESADPKSSQARRKSSKRVSHPEPAARKRKEIENLESTPNKRRRLSKEIRQEEVISKPEEANMLYQRLQPMSRKVSRQVIDSKWEPLPSACVEQVSQFLQDVQRPVVVRLNEERKRIQASTALQMVSRRLTTKISKGLPFPQATRSRREDDFDFEKILDHNRALEAQLTPALHGNELLEAELAKERAWLDADKNVLADLEKNAKSEATTRKQAARKMHALLQSDESLLETEALRDDIGMEDKDQQSLALDLRVQDDENLQGLVKGLHGHVDTIRGNMKQVDGIAEAIVRSKAAVQATLLDRLSNTQYGEVILGSD